MRITINLDPDVGRMLKDVLRDRDVTLNEAINDALRVGLKGASGDRVRFRQRTFSLGAGQTFRLDQALEMATALEDEELIGKMALRR
jgi:hypothetical protein